MCRVGGGTKVKNLSTRSKPGSIVIATRHPRSSPTTDEGEEGEGGGEGEKRRSVRRR